MFANAPAPADQARELAQARRNERVQLTGSQSRSILSGWWFPFSLKLPTVAALAAGVLAFGLGACAQKEDAKVTDLNNLQGDVIGKVNCSEKTFVLDADQAKGFAEFAGQWMTAEAFGKKWVEETGDSYGSELAMQVAEAAMGEACKPE